MLCTREGLEPKRVNAAPRKGPVLETPRLTLRPPQADDAAALAMLAGDIGVARMTRAIPHPFPRSAAERLIDHLGAADFARQVAFAVDGEDGDLVGVVALDMKNGPAPELGFWLGRPHWGKGYATEAVTAALDWVKDEWGKRFVVAGHFADNPAAGEVLVKAGFLYTGEVRQLASRARGGAEAPTRMMVWLA
ncbi:GNAT family N-acetyltransferase [Caulobacter sp. KR2-114]|uniref:GNAT family N-acetyltransferase n=1 Tax=Caulobacter sp. KR2-114 TaxID=3400912 RepID=UPI003C05194C